MSLTTMPSEPSAPTRRLPHAVVVTLVAVVCVVAVCAGALGGSKGWVSAYLVAGPPIRLIGEDYCRVVGVALV